MMIFKRVESYYHNMLAGIEVEALRIIVMGTAGTGKSYLIKAIRNMLYEMGGVESKRTVLVITLTGVTAFNIRGMTIHSALLIPISTNDNLDIEGERLKKLQDKLENVKYIIIDEKSMVRRKMLGLIDMRLRQAFSEYNNKPFGRRSIIMFRDFGQLSLVLDLPIYASSHGGLLSNDRYAIYQQFWKAYRLDVIERQSGNSEE